MVLVAALAVHVLDEALTDFLPLYNSVASRLRDSYGFLPLPTFTFGVWLGGLVTAVILLALLSPLVFAGRKVLRFIAYPLSIIMILNGLGRIAASVHWRTFAPGVYSSPLLIAAAALLFAKIKARRM